MDAGHEGCTPFHLPKLFVNAGMPDFPASGKSGTGTKIMQMSDPVQYRTDVGCRNADAGGISLDADVEQCILSC